jgi:hypothetical protein
MGPRGSDGANVVAVLSELRNILFDIAIQHMDTALQNQSHT